VTTPSDSAMTPAAADTTTKVDTSVHTMSADTTKK
jgi:hypothetical protein